jgi:hypothetical protein
MERKDKGGARGRLQPGSAVAYRRLHQRREQRGEKSRAEWLGVCSVWSANWETGSGE